MATTAAMATTANPKDHRTAPDAGFTVHASESPILKDVAIKAMITKSSSLIQRKAITDQTIERVSFAIQQVTSFEKIANAEFDRLSINGFDPESETVNKFTTILKTDFIALVDRISSYCIFKILLDSEDPDLEELKGSATKFDQEVRNLKEMLVVHTKGMHLNKGMYQAFIDGIRIELTGSEVAEDDRVGFLHTAKVLQGETSRKLDLAKATLSRLLSAS